MRGSPGPPSEVPLGGDRERSGLGELGQTHCLALNFNLTPLLALRALRDQERSPSEAPLRGSSPGPLGAFQVYLRGHLLALRTLRDLERA